MSKFFKKTLKRVSWRAQQTEGPQYPLTTPEAPTDLVANGNGVSMAHIASSELPEEDDAPDSPVTLAIIGAGQRGKNFADYARSHPRLAKVVAFAEPRPETRAEFAARHNIADKHAFSSHKELLTLSDVLIADGKPRIAQAVVICVQDKMHAELTIEFAKRGFHILCEKPLGIDAKECIDVTEEVEKSAVVYALGHNFPYSSYAASLSELVHSGTLGRLVHIEHLEPVGYYHFAHSYVRGNWQSEQTSAPIILTKSSHDLDIFCRWFHPLVPKHVSSFGGLSHFRRERKPPEAAARGVMRCLECPASVEQRCEYSAKRTPVLGGHTGWPGSLIVDGRPTAEKMTRALEETPYGLCVYESANDVPDHQTVLIEFSAPTDETDALQYANGGGGGALNGASEGRASESRTSFRVGYPDPSDRSASQSRERQQQQSRHRQLQQYNQRPSSIPRSHRQGASIATSQHYAASSRSHSRIADTTERRSRPRDTDQRREELPPMNPTVSFTLAAHTDSICVRKTTLYFEHGEVIGDMSTYTVSDFREFGRGPRRVVPPRVHGGGHGGGDWGLMDAWLKAIVQREKELAGGEESTETTARRNPLGVGATVRDQLRVFLTGFAIEEARKQRKVVDCEEFEARMLQSASASTTHGEEDSQLAKVSVEYEPEGPPGM
ncbi:hypothetical protein FRC17_004607 [Serendipita sp. 399]|nr:hypothetical protein FRC17_004607 [Serendipita sp. 399]